MTKKSKWRIVLVEDDPKKSDALEKALKIRLKDFDVDRFDTAAGTESGSYEDRLHRELDGEKIVLIVTDRDLSSLSRYPGLSEAVVSKVGLSLHVPVCVYAAGKTDSLLERQRLGGGGRIIVNSASAVEMAQRIAVIAQGFRDLRTLVEEIDRSVSERRKYGGPASVLAELLEAPEVVAHIALYSRGDQRMLDELTPESFKKSKKKAKKHPLDVQRVTFALGVWLCDSILRFPGILVDQIAAASFLDISPKAFSEATSRKPFATALYRGPFADDESPRWWRHRLAGLLEFRKVSEGRALVKKVTGKTLPPCECSVDKHAPAGFVCVMTGDPVCEAHSAGEVSWLPRGADLSRVRNDLFEQIGPWIGMS